MSDDKYHRLVVLVEEAEEALERLRGELEERRDDEVMDERPEEVDEATAAAAVIALSDVFSVVTALAEDGGPIELPSKSLGLADDALVTILANAELARRRMLADVKWALDAMERVRS